MAIVIAAFLYLSGGIVVARIIRRMIQRPPNEKLFYYVAWSLGWPVLMLLTLYNVIHSRLFDKRLRSSREKRSEQRNKLLGVRVSNAKETCTAITAINSSETLDAIIRSELFMDHEKDCAYRRKAELLPTADSLPTPTDAELRFIQKIAYSSMIPVSFELLNEQELLIVQALEKKGLISVSRSVNAVPSSWHKVVPTEITYTILNRNYRSHALRK